MTKMRVAWLDDLVCEIISLVEQLDAFVVPIVPEELADVNWPPECLQPTTRFKTCPGTYASLLLQAGEPMIYVKEQLGQTTVGLYGHVNLGKNRDAVDRDSHRRRTAPAR